MSSIVTCPGCGARNRVPDAAAGAPRCPRCKTPLPWVVDATPGQFDRLVEGPLPVLVDFWAPWCAPCRAFTPIFEAASEKHLDVVFAQVNTDAEQELAASFQVRSIPTLTIFRQQVGIFSQAGSLPASALEEVIQQAQALDMDEVRREIAAQSEARH